MKGVKKRRLLQIPKEEESYRKIAVDMLCKYISGDTILELDYPEEAMDATVLARELEEEIFKNCGNNKDEYYYYCRSRAHNISDVDNLEFRNKFILGDISPAELAVMSPEDMANAELKEQREKWWKEGIQESQLSSSRSTNVSMEKCSKCHQRTVTYTQLQTRSADEPMTTFYHCESCNNRWKR